MRHFDPRQTAIVRACMERHIAERQQQRRSRMRSAVLGGAMLLVVASAALAKVAGL